eukprot:TRINITY_DN9992_c0_g1_i1.p1 TRINITY_DN9992_c0_g1~~TRINITY_DN9992_c0_g1_i1.p1  ORF type:complete len:343 (+),score=57.71 TRINITY_DN9992_c0_g1_i1:66-1094(+)
MDYRNKVALAPMVRVGTLPMRMLSLKYGADIVYSEEVIAMSLMNCDRIVNDELGTIDFIHQKDKKLVYRTCPEERNKVIQIGTPNAINALEAAKVVINDVDAIDINMGCPVHFSTSGGMGSALLSKPETIHDILTTLRRNISKPLTCKIRILDTPQKTIDLMKMIEGTGVDAIGVHCRYVSQRPREPAHWDLLAPVVQSVQIPIIANGDVFKWEDVEKIKAETGASSVMIARGALWNPSIFNKGNITPQDQIMKEYVEMAHRYGGNFANIKYVCMKMLDNKVSGPLGQKLTRTKTLTELCQALEMEDLASVPIRKTTPAPKVDESADDNEPPNKARRTEEDN